MFRTKTFMFMNVIFDFLIVTINSKLSPVKRKWVLTVFCQNDPVFILKRNAFSPLFPAIQVFSNPLIVTVW